jgi:hypothetical protein
MRSGDGGRRRRSDRCAGVFPKERRFEGIAGLKKELLRQPDRFIQPWPSGC